MIEFNLWKSSIKDCLSEMSDLKYQHIVWLGHDPLIVSSFTELMCRLYDDFTFKDFIKIIPLKSFNPDLVKRLNDLDSKIESFNKSPASEKDDITIINDPAWIDIANDAKDILLKFKIFWA